MKPNHHTQSRRYPKPPLLARRPFSESLLNPSFFMMKLEPNKNRRKDMVSSSKYKFVIFVKIDHVSYQ